MPLYAYRCTTCGGKFEKIRNFSAEPETVCPKCGNATLIRPLTAPRLNFKGAGWYINDYAPKSSDSSSNLNRPGESKPAESKEASKSETSKSSDKPAALESSNASHTIRARIHTQVLHRQLFFFGGGGGGGGGGGDKSRDHRQQKQSGGAHVSLSETGKAISNLALPIPLN